MLTLHALDMDWKNVRDNLTDIVKAALEKAMAVEALPRLEPPKWKIELPNNPDHGDFATNLPLVISKAARMPPRKVAEIILANLKDESNVLASTEIAGPGFINFKLNPSAWHKVLIDIETDGVDFGRSNIGAGRRAQVEFVSANPTGPLHVGHGRGAVVGDVLARILTASGYLVQREYYVNDAGNQMRILGQSVYLRCLELKGRNMEFPEGLYRGDYIRDIAVEALADKPELLALPEDEAVAVLGSWAGDKILDGIRQDLKDFGVLVDRWFSEAALHESGEVGLVLQDLEARGSAYRSDGALWLRTSEYGDEKDRVLVKSDGLKTYFSADIAYHMDKFKRGFDEVVDVWGSDHHGYVPRVKAALDTVGLDSSRLHVLLVQFVNLLRNGQQVGMSTRAGEFVTLKEVVGEVGADAARFLFLTRSCDASLDFDLDVAKKQTADNPVFYVQYAHARITSIFKEAEKTGIVVSSSSQTDLSLLVQNEEAGLLKLLYLYPEVVEGAALNWEPHRVVYYLRELASSFHTYYNKYRFIGEDVNLSHARLCLARGVKRVLCNALGLLGVNAPETM